MSTNASAFSKGCFCDLAQAGVQLLSPYQPGKPAEELQRELGLSRVVKLASNENPLGPSANVLDAIQSALPGLSRYPDGNGFALKQALAEHLSVSADCITLGNGSNDVLELIARVFLGLGREAVFSQHAFAVYPLATIATGAKPVVAPALPSNSDQPFGHNLDAMLALINKQTGVVFVANPNNPTGTWLNHRQLESFISSVPPSVVIVLDQAYGEYINRADYPDAIDWLDRYPNLVITRTFSKAYGLAGLRVGYAIAHPEISDLLNRVRQPFNSNSLALVAAEAALQDQDYLAHARFVNDSGMVQLTQAFDQLGLSYIPSVGNFICFDTGQDAAPINEQLLQRGVIVRPIDVYQLPNHLRVSIGTEDENQVFIDALTEIMASV